MVADDNKPDPIDVEDHKTVTIVVEGTPHKWPKEYITYEQLVTLEVPDYSQNPQFTYHGDIQERPPQQARRHPLQGRHRQGRRRNGLQCFTNWQVINDDLRRLLEKGYAVAFDSNHLVVRDIPYLDSEGELQMGAIVAKLEFIDQVRVTQTDHQVYFAGSVPHGLDGNPIPNLGGGSTTIALSEACSDVVVQRSFSNKPKDTGRFADFFHKVESYVTIISGPAMEAHGVTPYTFRFVAEVPTDSVFKFHDTLTTRAEITDLAAKFKDDVIAIIGLGGTGAYLLDFMAKTPVREIRAFDLDTYHVHTPSVPPAG